MKWKTLNSQIVYSDPFCKIRRDSCLLPDGKKINYFVCEIRDWTMIVAFTPQNRIILTKQYRHPTGKIRIEFPAGAINKDEQPSHAIRREFLEETGFRLKQIKKIGCWFTSSGRSNSRIHVFVAKTTGDPKPQRLDSTEQIALLFKTPKQIQYMIKTGQICGAPYIAGFLAAKEKYPNWFE